LPIWDSDKGEPIPSQSLKHFQNEATNLLGYTLAGTLKIDNVPTSTLIQNFEQVVDLNYCEKAVNLLAIPVLSN